MTKEKLENLASKIYIDPSLLFKLKELPNKLKIHFSIFIPLAPPHNLKLENFDSKILYEEAVENVNNKYYLEKKELQLAKFVAKFKLDLSDSFKTQECGVMELDSNKILEFLEERLQKVEEAVIGIVRLAN